MREGPRVERAAPGSPDEWRGSLETNEELLGVILGREPLPDDGAELLECLRDRAAITALFRDTVATRDAAVAAAAASGHAAALAQSRSDGWIEVMVEGTSRRFPTGSRALTPGLWLHA